MVLGREATDTPNYAETIVLGSMLRDKLERNVEEFGKLIEEDMELAMLREVAGKGEKQYMRTRNSASAESAKRAKSLKDSQHLKELHMLFEANTGLDMEKQREEMLAKVSGFRPVETVFEIGKRGTASSEASEIMRKRRNQVHIRSKEPDQEEPDAVPEVAPSMATPDEDDLPTGDADFDMEEASDDELEITFSQPETKKSKTGNSDWQDSEHFMSYNPSSLNMAEDRGYGVHSGSYNDSGKSSNFLTAARSATMDLNNDDNKAFAEASKAKGLRWDKKNKKYVARANDEDGSKGSKFIQGESGLKIAASLRSGRFDAWRKANKISALPRVGEAEKVGWNPDNARRYKHKGERAPKDADKYRDDYFERKRKVEAAKEKGLGKYGKTKGKNELRGVDDVRKARNLQQKKKEKNARPAKRRG